MDDNREKVRAYSQERHIYRARVFQSSSLEISSRKEQISVSSRNRPEILSLFTTSNARLREFEDKAQRAIANQRREFDMINYSLRSRPTTPTSSKIFSKNSNDKQQPLFPSVTPAPAAKGKKFPNPSPSVSPAPHHYPYGDHLKQAPMPTIKISKGYMPPSLKKPVKRWDDK